MLLLLALCMHPGRTRENYEASLELLLGYPHASLAGAAPKGLGNSGVLIEIEIEGTTEEEPPVGFDTWEEFYNFFGVVDVSEVRKMGPDSVHLLAS